MTVKGGGRMIRKFIFYVGAMAFDIVAVNFFIDPVVGTMFFAIFGEHTAAYNILRIIILMGLLVAACLFVNHRDSTLLEACSNDMEAARIEGVKYRPISLWDMKAFLGELFAFGFLGLFMMVYITPALFMHGEWYHFIICYTVIIAVVVAFVPINFKFANEKRNAFIRQRLGDDFFDEK